MARGSVLVVTNSKAFFANTIKEVLNKYDYKPVVKNPLTSEISSVTEELIACFVMLDEELIKEKNTIPALTFLKDQIIEKDIPAYIIGYPEDIKLIEEVIPANLILDRYIRPINMSEVIEQFDESIKENAIEGKKKILIVDDSGQMLRTEKSWFEKDYRVFVANSGTAAIKSMVTNRPDLILLDYEMPVIDGKQVLAMIRSEEDFADIPVIFLTGKDDRETVESVLALKPEGYLLKSMAPMKIEKAVKDFFLRQKANQ